MASINVNNLTNCQLNCKINLSNYAPFESFFIFLSNIFSLNLDPVKRSRVKLRKLQKNQKMASAPDVTFREFTVQRFDLQLWTEKANCRFIQGLSTGLLHLHF